MNDAFGLIYTGENDLDLHDLTRSRCVAAMPIGGRYRVIDVLISALVHSGIHNVGLIMQKNYHSLMDHLGSGREWDLNRRTGGLFLQPPYITRENTGTYEGLLDAVRSNIGYILRSAEPNCLLMSSHTVFNAEFNDMRAFHKERGADITVMYDCPTIIDGEENLRRVNLGVDGSGRVMDVEIGARTPHSANVSMDVFFMDKLLLKDMVDMSVAHGRFDFNREVLQKRVQDLKIYGYKYDGYVTRLNSVNAFYRFNMDLLGSDVRNEMLVTPRPVFTKVKNEAPAYYAHDAHAEGSLVADGCIVEGEVENCVLFRGVRIGRGSKVSNCILMQGTSVGEGARLNYVVTDKGVTIKRDRQLSGQPAFPIVVRKNAIV